MNAGDALSERYEVIRELGRGGAGVTWLAREAATGREVVAKVLHLGLLSDWKAVELFEREAAVLRALHHPGIPAYVDFFTAEIEGVPRFVLVREYVQGTSLQARVTAGWRGTEETIRDIGVRLLRIVAYIHGVRPPVIHRDINPRNIIQRDDGEVFLLDFGGVQDAIRLSIGATNTVVGTPGYTPLEQFVGRGSVRSDLYAVAATLLFLLTHRNPADLPVKDMKIDVPSVIEVTSPGLARVLSIWLEPDEARRTLSIEDAIALLEGRAAAPRPAPRETAGASEGPVPTVPARPPYGSRIQRGEAGNTFVLPNSGSGSGFRVFGGFFFFWVMAGGFLTSSAFRSGRFWTTAFTALPFIVMGLSSLTWSLSRVLATLGIRISSEGFTWTRKVLFFSRKRTVPLEDVGTCRIEGSPSRTRYRYRAGWGEWEMGRRSRRLNRSGSRLSLDVGIDTLKFGESLSQRELEWLRDAMNEELAKARAGAGLPGPGMRQEHPAPSGSREDETPV